MAELAAWTESRVRQAVTEARLTFDSAKAAVMLHTEVGCAVSDQHLTRFHVDMARAFLRAVTGNGRRQFAVRWAGLVVVLFAGHHDFIRARHEAAGDRLAHLLAAAAGLLQALRTGDRVSLLTFSDLLQVRAAMSGDFASVGALLSDIAGAGQTALRDAVAFGIGLRRDGATRPLMLVFTDGIDNASWLTDEAVLDSARRAGIVTHVIRVPGQETSSSRFVEELTEATGGRIWSASSARDLEVLFAQALEEMRARYLLTFSPRGPARSGWHELKVKLRRRGADIISRPGYFVNR